MCHPFKPTANDPSRCAYCLRKLDCAPHLPIAPSPTWPALYRDPRRYTTTGNPRPELRQFAAHSFVAAVSRAAR